MCRLCTSIRLSQSSTPGACRCAAALSMRTQVMALLSSVVGDTERRGNTAHRDAAGDLKVWSLDAVRQLAEHKCDVL